MAACFLRDLFAAGPMGMASGKALTTCKVNLARSNFPFLLRQTQMSEDKSLFPSSTGTTVSGFVRERLF